MTVITYNDGGLEPAAQLPSTVVVRFCGDSGDGVQLAGNRFTSDAVLGGSDVVTFPEFPAEIRAPAGSRAGVSAFQVRFGEGPLGSHGDAADVLVALNPAALATNIQHIAPGGIVIVDQGAFTPRAVAQAGYAADPLDALDEAGVRLVAVDMTAATLEATRPFGVKRSGALKARNFLALGLVYSMFGHDEAGILEWIGRKFAADVLSRDANRVVFRAGTALAEALELAAFDVVRPAAVEHDGAGRTVTGNEALSLGLMTAAALAGRHMVVGAYPITPASDILHFLARERDPGVTTFQAEDEIAAVGAAIGASYAGAIGVTATSGPGLALKSESIGLAVALELPLVVVDVQRAGPSTGMPTRTEQGDLDIALAGRSGEAPLPVIAARSPADCFDAAIEAVRIAVEHMTPVILLSDAALAVSSEPWRAPDFDSLAPIRPPLAQAQAGADQPFQPFVRGARQVRRWAPPGTPGLQHRIGGLEKADGSGAISYDGANHEAMTSLRAGKVAALGERLDDAYDLAGERQGRLLLVTWGGAFGAVREAVSACRRRGLDVSHLDLRWLNPLDEEIGAIMRGFDRVVVPEQNRGQLAERLRARFLVDARPLSQMQGRPFGLGEIQRAITGALVS